MNHLLPNVPLVLTAVLTLLISDAIKSAWIKHRRVRDINKTRDAVLRDLDLDALGYEVQINYDRTSGYLATVRRVVSPDEVRTANVWDLADEGALHAYLRGVQHGAVCGKA